MKQREARDLYAELQQAKNLLTTDIETFDKLRSRYGGPFYKLTGKDAAYDPENTAYIWVTNVISQVVHNDPTWIVESEQGGVYAITAGLKKQALDKWTRNEKLSEFLMNGPALDAQFLRGIAVMKLEPQKRGYKLDDKALMPTLDRISPRDYCEDSTAKEHDDATWKAHRVVTTRKALLARAEASPGEGWNIPLIKSLQSSTTEMSQLDQQRRSNLNRDEIVYWQVWDREWEGDEDPDYDANGGLMEIVEPSGEPGDDFTYLRKPRPAYCPPWGPYYHFDAGKIPDEAHGLAPLVAVMQQSEDLNAAARAQLEDENSYMRFLLIDEMSAIDPRTNKPVRSGKKLAEIIANARHRKVFTAPAFDRNKAMEFEVGGPSAQGAASFANRLERHDRMMGLSQSRQGNTGSGQTATSDVIADQAAERRIGLIRMGIHRPTTQIGYGFLWYLQRERSIAVMVGAGPDGGEVWVNGGDWPEDDDFGAYSCKIEPMSMEMTSPAVLQAQAQMMQNFFGLFAPLMPTTPWVNWKRLAQVTGNAWNVPYMGELIDEQKLGEATGTAQEAQEAEIASQKTAESKVTTVAQPNVPKVGAPTAHGGGGGKKPHPMVGKPLTPTPAGSTKGTA